MKHSCGRLSKTKATTCCFLNFWLNQNTQRAVYLSGPAKIRKLIISNGSGERKSIPWACSCMRCGLNTFSIPEGLIIGLTDRLRYSSVKTLARFAGVPRRKGKNWVYSKRPVRQNPVMPFPGTVSLLQLGTLFPQGNSNKRKTAWVVSFCRSITKYQKKGKKVLILAGGMKNWEETVRQPLATSLTFTTFIVRVWFLSFGADTLITSICVDAYPIKTTNEDQFFALVNI